MGKYKRDRVIVRDKHDSNIFVDCSFDVNIDSEANFYMRFSDEEIKKLKDANVDMETGFKLKGQYKEGYLFAKTYEELIAKVRKTLTDCISRKLVEEKIVISYAIQTQASYAMSEAGEICPNPSKEWTGMEYYGNPQNTWKEGNVPIHACNQRPFGFLVYARPYIVRKYQYASGQVKIEYTAGLSSDDYAREYMKNGYNLRWLSAVPCIAKPSDVAIQELDYTEPVAEFFVNMIKSICIMNEKMKDFLHPEAILKLANERHNFLGTGSR